MPGMGYHFGGGFQIGAAPFRSNTIDWVLSANQITGRRFPVWAKYQSGVTSLDQLSGIEYPLQVGYLGFPLLQIKYQAGAAHSDQMP